MYKRIQHYSFLFSSLFENERIFFKVKLFSMFRDLKHLDNIQLNNKKTYYIENLDWF
jgi:hypothetical protein